MLTDEEKLYFAKNALKIKIMQVDDWDQFKSWIAIVTPTRIKNLIIAALEDREAAATGEAAEQTTLATDLDSLSTEITNIS